MPDSDAAAERIDEIKSRGYRIAVDDVGAGYAGLTSLVSLEPDVVKLDMALVRNLHTSAVRRHLVGSLLSVGHELGIEVVAEGVETAEEHAALLQLGCRLFQGWLCGRPAPLSHWLDR